MAFQYCTSAQLAAPAAAAGVSLVPSGTAWTSGAWVQIIAATSSAIVVTGLDISTFGVTQSFEIDIGVGASGSEVVVTTFRGHCADTSFHGQGRIPLPIPVDNIASGARVAARIRVGNSSAVAWTVSITYMAKPLTGTMLTTAKPQKCTPSSANGTTVTAGAVWVSGSWAQIVASTAAALVVVGLVVTPDSSNTEWELDLGTGASGSESVITTVRGNWGAGLSDAPLFIPLWIPLDNVAASARLSARLRASSATVAPAVTVVYMEKPL